MEDHYQTLGVQPGAGRAEVERSYRRLARRHHPDLLHQARPEVRYAAETRLKRINAAYTVLGNPARRLAYDRERVRQRGPIVAPRPAPPPRASSRPAATTSHWQGGGPIHLEWPEPVSPATPTPRADFRWFTLLLWAAATLVLFAVLLAMVWRPVWPSAPVSLPLPTPIP